MKEDNAGQSYLKGDYSREKSYLKGNKSRVKSNLKGDKSREKSYLKGGKSREIIISAKKVVTFCCSTYSSSSYWLKQQFYCYAHQSLNDKRGQCRKWTQYSSLALSIPFVL